MIKQFKHKNIIWVNVASPTKEEIKNLTRSYNLHYLISQDLVPVTDSTPTGRVEFFPEHIYLTTDWPGPAAGNSINQPAFKLKVIIGQNLLITIHYDPLPPLDDLGRIFGPQLELNQEALVAPGLVFFYLIRQLYQATDQGLVDLTNTIDNLTYQPTEPADDSRDNQLNRIERQINTSIRPLAAQGAVWQSLLTGNHPLLTTNDKTYIKQLHYEHQYLINQITDLREILNRFNQKQKLKILTAITNQNQLIIKLLVLVAPLLILLALLGVNVHIPLLADHPYAFYLVIGLAGLSVLLTHKLIRRSPWL